MKSTGEETVRRRKALPSLLAAFAGGCLHLAARSEGTPAKGGCDAVPQGPFDITQCQFLTNAVLVHFDTEADRRYELQFTTNVLVQSGWRKSFAPPVLPFKNHYVVYHEMTNGPTGCFRLLISP